MDDSFVLVFLMAVGVGMEWARLLHRVGVVAGHQQVTGVDWDGDARVRMAAGWIEFTRMPYCAYSSASVFMSPTTPNFEEQ